MNEEREVEPLNRRDDAWLEGVMAFDARSPHHSSDEPFVSSVMANLPMKRWIHAAQLARLFLAGLACSAAVLVVVENSQVLAAALEQATPTVNAPQLVTAVASLFVLLGLVGFSFTLQRDL